MRKLSRLNKKSQLVDVSSDIDVMDSTVSNIISNYTNDLNSIPNIENAINNANNSQIIFEAYQYFNGGRALQEHNEYINRMKTSVDTQQIADTQNNNQTSTENVSNAFLRFLKFAQQTLKNIAEQYLEFLNKLSTNMAALSGYFSVLSTKQEQYNANLNSAIELAKRISENFQENQDFIAQQLQQQSSQVISSHNSKLNKRNINMKKMKKAQNLQSEANDQAGLNSNQVEDPVRSLADIIEKINTEISKKNSMGNVFQGDEKAGIEGLDTLSGENNVIYGINIYDNAVHSAIENFDQGLIDKEEFVDQLQSQYGTNDQVLKIPGELEETGEKQMQSSQKIKKMVLASTAYIKELAERDVENSSKTFSLEKTAQHQTVDELVLHGPGSKRISPFTGQLESDWHVIERNKGWGFRVGDLWNIDFETMWRRHIMDKYYRPYKDDKGNWTGGYLQKRFEIDRWQPEENKMQLLPGQKRRPIIQEQRSTESRLEAARGKKLETQNDKKFEGIKLAKTVGFCVENYVGHKKKS